MAVDGREVNRSVAERTRGIHRGGAVRGKPRGHLTGIVLSLLVLFLSPLPGESRQIDQGERDTPAREGRATVPSLQAVRIEGTPPHIDGDLSDPAWRRAMVARDFVQVEPREGAPASERTEARVLYDDEALYVGIRAYDAHPDSIVGQLTRRGQQSYSDVLHVLVDSYADRRTAFRFTVNPLGVQTDAYHFDDHREDEGWEAVWEVATQIDSLGWTAEFRIPLSQLRFPRVEEQTWGINFGREIARRGELSVWSPFSAQERARVSRFGRLTGLRELRPGARMELLPYTAANLARSPGEADDPYWRRSDAGIDAGLDLRMGIMRNLTLDATVNPDFGQVEADPARVNLTAFETFLPEQRPFFQEGAGIFRFGIGLGDGDGENQTLFYSRRIGRAPQGSPPAGAEWADAPSRTRILGAAKVSGQPGRGWSVGGLGAVTGEARARVTTDGVEERIAVEPRTTYGVGRVQRDLREGESAVGAIATLTHREGAAADRLALRRDGYAGGVDFRHRFREGTMELRGYLLGSHVSGSRDAIARTQGSSARYFQRPDAPHLEMDTLATSLAGWSGTLELWKMGGGPWKFAALTQARSPGFEVNDLGFMPQADYVTQAGFVGYFHNEPGAYLRTWNLNTNVFGSWSFGGERTGGGGNVNGSLTTNGHLGLYGGVNVNPGALDPRLLRGGPAMRTESGWNGWAGVNSDGRRDLQASWHTNWSVRPESDSWSLDLSPSVRWRPSGSITLRGGPFLNRRVEDRQWVAGVQAGEERHYLFGRMDQTTAGMNLRADMALTPRLSLQLYAQPFMSSGEFSRFKRVSDPRADRYEDRFQPLHVVPEGGRYHVDLDGNGEAESFAAPHFERMQFRSNAVLRLEYRPGSTLYVVWAQSRDHVGDEGRFRVGDGIDTLFSAPPENVFMVKMSHWLNP
jgi:hypothetical protein